MTKRPVIHTGVFFIKNNQENLFVFKMITIFAPNFTFMHIEFAQIVKIATRHLVNNTGQIPNVPANPRTITEDEFKQLKQRIAKTNLLGIFPLRVFKYEGKYVVLGGNQRLRAVRQLKFADVPCIVVPENADAETLQEIIILENTHDGEYDNDMLANEWDAVKLADWGVKQANWGVPEEKKKKSSRKRNCIYIELNDCDELMIGNTMYSAGDSIDASDLRFYLDKQ